MNEVQQLTTDQLQALALLAFGELVGRWLAERDDGGASVRTHLESGAGLELVAALAPEVGLGLRLVDSDGSYIALRSFVVPED